MRKALAVVAIAITGALEPAGQAPEKAKRSSVDIPRTWDEDALKSLEVPLAQPDATPQHISSDYYYRVPIRKVFKSYPIYHPAHEPKPDGKPYLKWLEEQRPQEILNDFSSLTTEADWQAKGPALGKDVFEAPIADDADTFFGIVRLEDVRNPSWYQRNGVPYTDDGVMPFARYVVTDQGVRVGNLSCAMCHTRVIKVDLGGKSMVFKGRRAIFHSIELSPTCCETLGPRIRNKRWTTSVSARGSFLPLRGCHQIRFNPQWTGRWRPSSPPPTPYRPES